MHVALAVLIGCLLAVVPQRGDAADAECSAFSAGSLAEIECRHVQARLQQQRDAVSAAQQMAVPLGAASKFVCPDEKAQEISDLQGMVGAEVRGTYRNAGDRPFSEIIVAFLLYDGKDQLKKTVESAVMPRTVKPGETGTFSATLPAPQEVGWRCFRYDISGLPE